VWERGLVKVEAGGEGGEVGWIMGEGWRRGTGGERVG